MKILPLLSVLCWVHVLAFKEQRNIPNGFARSFVKVVNSLFPENNEWQSNGKGSCFSNFRCYNGSCINADLTCDGIVDCEEAEDEIDSYCSGRRRVDPRLWESPVETKSFKETWNKITDLLPMRQAMCSDIQFFCSSDSKCISISNVCDQTNECSQGEDEQNCEFVTCPENYMKCDTGRCIPNYWICDQIQDCPSGEDETGLDCSTRVCSGNRFRCDTGACLPKHWRCDGQVDCLHGDDEKDCITCPSESIPCQDGQSCITMPQICDGVTDCGDGTDEKNCNVVPTIPTSGERTAEPHCSGGLLCEVGSYLYCIPMQKICDGIVNCWDGSDEDSCTTPLVTTQTTTKPTTTVMEEILTTEPPCKDGLLCKVGSYVYCIPKQKICDGIVNCWDGSDEDSCTTPLVTTQTTTKPTTTVMEEILTTEPPCKDGLLCKVGSYVYCIPKQKICDGIVNCWDGSDEDSCTTPLVTTEPTTKPTTTVMEEILTTEPPCKDGLLCKVGSYVYCIPKQKICDGIVNCWDGSDEDSCTTPLVTTETTTKPTTTVMEEIFTTESPCKDGMLCKVGSYVYCIPKQKICDGIVNCWDGSDEDSCTTPLVTTETTTKPTTTVMEENLTTEPPCKDRLLCKVGSYVYCIPKQKICDGIVNCWDGSDEDSCTTPLVTTEPTTKPTTTIMEEILTTEPPCKDGLLCKVGSYVYCIPKQKICDGIVNCWDGSDEDSCTTPLVTTQTTTKPTTTVMEEILTTEPPCKDGLLCKVGSYVYCIPKQKICDGIVNCWDGSDEDSCTTPLVTTEPTTKPTTTIMEEILTTEPPCKDGLLCKVGSYVYCIPKQKICDGIVNCWDGSDEDSCTTPLVTTQTTTKPTTTVMEEILTTEPPCKDGLLCKVGSYVYCIPKQKICDGIVNCWDGSDEDSCTTPLVTTEPTTKPTTTVMEEILTTEPPCKDGLLCKVGSYVYCIPKQKICDGIVNCWDGSDEDSCTTPLVTTEPTQMSTTREVPCKNGFLCKIGPYMYCTPNSKLCDGVLNCWDGSDEEGCTTPKVTMEQTTLKTTTELTTTSMCGEEFLCRSNSWMYCIPSQKICDGVGDCPDMSDERECTTPVSVMTTRQSPELSTVVPPCPGYVCAVTLLCLPNMLVCDGVSDCPMGDDEGKCTVTTAPPITITCVLGQFECNDGSCISVSQSCDNVIDCPNGEDEDNCQAKDNCEVRFQCKTDGVCLEQNEWCDGSNDCSDGSDEMDCGDCGAGKFACSSEICIDRNKLCDGVPDCPGPDDENGCTVIEQCVGMFDCGNGYCVDMADRCDGESHCNNERDEIDCPVRRGCADSDFQCHDGKCIPNSMRCNGVYGDCTSGEDEENCDECSHYMCPNKRCLTPSEMCDGVNDCLPGGEDEDPAECKSYQAADKQRVVSDKTAEKLANQISVLLESSGQTKGGGAGGRDNNEVPDKPISKLGSKTLLNLRDMRRVQHLKEILQRHFNKV